MKQVKFTAMENGNQQDYDLLCEGFEEYTSNLPKRVLDGLIELKTAYEGYQISRYEHSLQTATRAYRYKENEEMIVAVNISTRNKEPPRAMRFLTIEKHFFKIPSICLLSVLTFVVD